MPGILILYYIFLSSSSSSSSSSSTKHHAMTPSITVCGQPVMTGWMCGRVPAVFALLHISLLFV